MPSKFLLILLFLSSSLLFKRRSIFLNSWQKKRPSSISGKRNSFWLSRHQKDWISSSFETLELSRNQSGVFQTFKIISSSGTLSLILLLYLQHLLILIIHSLMTYDTQYNNREIEYIEHNNSSDASSLWAWPPDRSPVGGAERGWHGAHGWSNKPRLWRIQCRAGSSKPVRPPCLKRG